jgi:hypothetical protein
MRNVCVFDIKKKNIPPVQVKNKPNVRESKHAFILGSTVNMVANSTFSYSFPLSLMANYKKKACLIGQTLHALSVSLSSPQSEKLVPDIPLPTLGIIGFQKPYTKMEVGAGLTRRILNTLQRKAKCRHREREPNCVDYIMNSCLLLYAVVSTSSLPFLGL